MGKLHGAVAVLQFRQVTVVRLRRFVNDCKHTLCGSNGVLQFRHHAADLVERLGVLVGIGEEACQLTNGDHTDQRHIAGSCQCSADTHSGIDQSVDKTCHRIGDRTEKCCLCSGLLQFGIVYVKPFFRTLFIGKRLDNFLRADHLLHQTAQCSAGIGGFQIGGTGHLCNFRRNQQGDRRENDYQNGNADVDRQHKDQRTQNGENTSNKLGERL